MVAAGVAFSVALDVGFFAATSFFFVLNSLPVSSLMFLGVAATRVVFAIVYFSMVTTLVVVGFSMLDVLALVFADCVEMLGRTLPFPFLIFSDLP